MIDWTRAAYFTTLANSGMSVLSEEQEKELVAWYNAHVIVPREFLDKVHIHFANNIHNFTSECQEILDELEARLTSPLIEPAKVKDKNEGRIMHNTITQEQLIETIAEACHTVNASYCRAVGDPWTSWVDASEGIRESSRAGVRLHLANPDTSPEEAHQKWSAYKVAEGWVYGPLKDEAAKTHPCLVPYDRLPTFQRIKDYLFIATVRTQFETISKFGVIQG